MPVVPILLLSIQIILLGIFCYFAFFKYLYGVASLWSPKLPNTPPSGHRCAVVIVAYNEEFVVEETLKACEKLTYPNHFVILADDSTDPDIIAQRREMARSRGCTRRQVLQKMILQIDGASETRTVSIEIWESEDFVLLLRSSNVGFKAGSLVAVHEYLETRNVNHMYLLDADWHPQSDALERSFSYIEADDELAFIQTKRIARRSGMNHFQRICSIMEETCYFVDFRGRQVLKHPILFSGCCALFNLNRLRAVGGFQSGHLTEDIDLTNRLWLAGYKGAYADDIVNSGEVPFSYDHYRKQQERWAAGTTSALRSYFLPIISAPHLAIAEKLAMIRQNAYFFANLFTIAAFCVGFLTVSWILLHWNSFAVEYYLYTMGKLQNVVGVLALACVGAAFVGPILMIAVHKRSLGEMRYLPLAFWYSWSIVFSYLWGNLRGLLGWRREWFKTPKPKRNSAIKFARSPIRLRLLYIFAAIVFSAFYFIEGWAFGWFDLFAVIWLPSLFLASRG